MAGFISRTENLTWTSPNWVYWGFMDHVLDSLRSLPEIAHRAEGCKWMQILSFEIIDEDDREASKTIFAACREVARKCADGELLCKVDGRVLDADSQKQFQEAMHELVEVLES